MEAVSDRPSGFWWVRLGPHRWDDSTKPDVWVPAEWSAEWKRWTPWSYDGWLETVHQVGLEIPYPHSDGGVPLNARMLDQLHVWLSDKFIIQMRIEDNHGLPTITIRIDCQKVTRTQPPRVERSVAFWLGAEG